MVDRISKEQRSAVMSRIKSKKTKPEMVVRRSLHRLGYRYRLHAPELKGRPDIVFRQRRAVIFVHGCYWHGHRCKIGGRAAQSNTDYWGPKIARNMVRDEETIRNLAASGWRVLVIRECEIADELRLKSVLVNFLEHQPPA